MGQTIQPTLYRGDCFKILPKIPARSIDAVIADPPYGTTDLPWDVSVDLKAFWSEVGRVLKPCGVVVLFSQQPLTTDLINSNRKQFRYELVWAKNRATGHLDAKRRPMRAHEHVLVFSDKFKGTTYNPQKTPGKPYTSRSHASRHYGHHTPTVTRNETGERYPRSVLHFAGAPLERGMHPTQKPVDLLRWLVLTYTHPGERVLDPFSGSGTTGVACALEGRAYVGIEQDASYARLQRRRLRDACRGR